MESSKPSTKKFKTEAVGSTSSSSSMHLHWSNQLRTLLQNVEPLGVFVHKSSLKNLPQMMPNVSVGDIGRLGFPLYNVAVNDLISASSKAPYGQGKNTLLNTQVRDAWQIDATKVTIGGGDVWTSYFTETVRRHCGHLGISSDRYDRLGIQAHLYKMLIYEECGHFVPHRDTEKEVNMFGTLVLQLPTSEGFTGGDFTVTHQGVTKTLDLATGSDNAFNVVSFYADCEHQLHPIMTGKRVCLIYNLVATTAEPTWIPTHDVNFDYESKLRMIVNDWNTGEEDNITKIGHPLAHKYSHQSIGVSTLKGIDEVVFSTLKNAKSSLGVPLFHVSLLLMERYLYLFYDKFYHESVKALILIEEQEDGSYTKQQLAEDTLEDEYWRDMEPHVENDENWGMMCYSKKGLWVMKGQEYIDVGDNHIEMLEDDKVALLEGNDEDDKVHDFDEDNYDTHDHERYDPVESIGRNEFKDDDDYGTTVLRIPDDRKMFHTPYQTRTIEYPYTGNEGSQEETWYYAAAIILSPYQAQK